jgi:hypothetical protein
MISENAKGLQLVSTRPLVVGRWSEDSVGFCGSQQTEPAPSLPSFTVVYVAGAHGLIISLAVRASPMYEKAAQ